MLQVAFTLCSNNYLAHAKTLGDSLRLTNPAVKFVIGLTDKFSPEIDYSFFEPFEILPYDKIGVDLFEDMVLKYNIIEFNTSVKPFYFDYLFNTFGRDSVVYYLDPDIFVYSSFDVMHDLLLDYDFLVTPHITVPLLEPSYYETAFLNSGIYNLGFLGMRYSDNTHLFLKWWQNRLRDHCYIDYSRGLFVDQIWVNLIHLLFQKVYILRSPGYNMASWNFCERELMRIDEKYYVNDSSNPLIFFHFSQFNPANPTRFVKHRAPVFTSTDRPDLADLFYEYSVALRSNKYEQLNVVGSLLDFRPMMKVTARQRIGKSIKIRIDQLIKIFFDV